MIRLALVAALTAPAPVATPTPGRDEAAVYRLVDAFLAAERAYDPAALERLVTPDFVEVSPKGEVDAHDRFLGFYAPDKRSEMPPITLGERTARVAGDGAIVIAKLAMTLPGRPEPAELRATFIARRAGGGWKLAGTQFTAIRH